MTKSTAWYADRYHNKYGFEIVPLKPSSKLPIENDWGNKTLNGNAKDYYASNPNHNIGLELGKSNMCSLDIDCMESFMVILDEFGIPEDELKPYPAIQGKGLRLLFRVPEGVNLPYCKVNWPAKNDPTGEKHRAAMRIAKELKDTGQTEREARVRKVAKRWAHYTVVELRTSQGRQRFDVLPPSIHPDTNEPYKWVTQPPKQGEWPEPPAWLMAIWSAWKSFEPQLKASCPWKPKEEPKTKPKPKQHEQPNGELQANDITDAYKQANPIESQLLRYGYTQKGKRYLSPHSSTGLPGVHLLSDESCWIHHASDPLCSEESGQPVNSYDLFVYYDHEGDRSKAFKAAADELGISLKRQREDPPKPETRSNDAPPRAESEQPSTKQQPKKEHEPPEQETNHFDFITLGFNESSGYFLPKRTEQVTKFSLGSLRKQNLLQLASLEWWECRFPNKTGIDWDAAYNAVNRWCESAGVYDDSMQRGRGAWFDKGRSVLHLGDRLLIDGKQTQLTDYTGRFIYARQSAFENGFDAVPATAEDGKKVASIFEGLNWAKPEHALLMAGWAALAPVCGSLKWRPHMWLTAQRGAGKSWVQETVIDKLVGRMMVYCQGGTTEAGIRQKINHDARPVMFDEAESEDQKAISRIQSVIELARQSSSDSGAEIMKGTVNGSGMSFRMRSMFLMGSINVGLKLAADESRFTIAALKKPSKAPESVDKFRKFEAMVLDTLTDDFCKSIRARTYHMIPVIRENAKTFSDAVAKLMGSQRIGDQVGTLMAGYFSLVCDELISFDVAKGLIESLDFEESKEAEQVSDEDNCLNRILQRQVRIDGSSGAVARSIGELIGVAFGEHDNAIDLEGARRTLPRYGVIVEKGRVFISNNHKEIEQSLVNTGWQSGWSRILARLEGAEKYPNSRKFAGSQSRCVSIPENIFT